MKKKVAQKNKHRREHKMFRQYFAKPITKTFIQAFPKFKKDEGDTSDVKYFWETWKASPFFDTKLTEADLNKVYNHLLATYYNWHFIYTDDLGIALNVMHIIEDYYPNCKERLSIVEQLRELELDEFKKSGINIDSMGANPKTVRDMDKLIDMVDSQTANFQIKSTEQTLKAKFYALYDGVMEEFISRFKPLFVKIYSGLNNYVYCNPEENNEEEE